MKTYEFYHKYANTPIGDRMKCIDIIENGMTTLQSIYLRLHQVDEIIRPHVIEQEKLLRIADKYYDRKEREREQDTHS